MNQTNKNIMETKLTKTQQDTVMILNQLITDKYEELIWNECYYDGDNEIIKGLLGQLQSEGVEVNFGVTVTPYLMETVDY
jgi:hypothetical protein